MMAFISLPSFAPKEVTSSYSSCAALLSALNNNMVVVGCWDCFLLLTKKVLPYWLKMKGFVCLSHKSQRNVTSLFVSSCIVKRKPIEDPNA